MPTPAQRWAGRVALGGHLLRQGPYDLGPVQGWPAAQPGGGRSPSFVSSAHVIVMCFSRCPDTTQLKSVSIQQISTGPGPVLRA